METLISDKNIKPVGPPHHSQSSSSLSSPNSSASTSPPITPGFEPNAQSDGISASDVTVPALIASLQANPDRSPKARLEDLNIPDLDLSQPISALLKVGTQRAHVEAENSKGAAALVKGDLELQEYVRWLAVLWRVYDALELGLSEHATNPVLAPTYDPTVLARANSLAQDISYLLTLLPAGSGTSYTVPDGALPPFALPHFLAPVFNHTPPPLAAYLSHLKHLSSSSSTAPGLLAHSYVRYLGDLSGGQFIAARVKKAYKLDGPDGLRFYHFDLQSREGEEETRADTKRRAGEVKDWFRKGMDEGVGESEDLKATLIREANLAFALNTHLFSLIRPPLSIPQTHPDGTPLRYYERMELENQARKANMIESPPVPSQRWSDRIERALLFSAAIVLTVGFTQYVIPYLQGLGLGGSGGEL